MNKLIKEKLINYYNENKDMLESIIIGGSSNLSYINNAHDIDIYVTFITRENVRDKMNSLLKLQQEVKAIEDKIMILPHFLEVTQHWYDETSPISEALSRRAELPGYAYIFRYDGILCGEDTVGIKNIDVLTEPTRSRYIKSLKKYVARVKEVFNDRGWYEKSIYHLLTGIYILQNNSYDLTEEQIANINLAHDKQCTHELYEFVITEIDKL